MSVRDNILLASLGKHARAGYLAPRRENAVAAGIIARLGIKVSNPHRSISSLSGGNQQKAVIAKCLLTSPKVLLLDEPTRGVDVGARAEIFETISQLARQGMGIVFASCDLHEVLTLAQRTVVLSRGRVTGEFASSEATGPALVAAACAVQGVSHARH
jgi:erythritol transport system ATP-binding protein